METDGEGNNKAPRQPEINKELSKTKGSNNSQTEKGTIIYEDLEHSTYKYEKDGSYVKSTKTDNKYQKSRNTGSASKDDLSKSVCPSGNKIVENGSANPIIIQGQKPSKKITQEDDGFMSPWKSNIDTPNLYLIKKD